MSISLHKKLRTIAMVAAFATLFASCDTEELPMEAPAPSEARGGPTSDVIQSPYTFSGGPVFDIEAAPNGNILVPVTVFAGAFEEGKTSTSTLYEIRTQGPGGEQVVTEITTPKNVPINGLASTGSRSAFATQGGLDKGFGAALVHVTPDGARVVADIGAFEIANDPDDGVIADWKDLACAAASGEFTPGPQTNPFKVVHAPDGNAIVGDAAGNTVLRVTRSGQVELVATLTPPTADGAESDDPADWLEFPFPGAADGDCYVQPVPTAVAIGPDGHIFVGELTGVDLTASFVTPLGVSRVWRIEPGAKDVLCPSAQCQTVLTGLTSIIDLAFGPDGYLYVVEYDENGWLAPVSAIPAAGGTVNRCDVVSGACSVAQVGGETLSGLNNPAAIAFDKWGQSWLLENNLIAPSVRRVN